LLAIAPGNLCPQQRRMSVLLIQIQDLVTELHQRKIFAKLLCKDGRIEATGQDQLRVLLSQATSSCSRGDATFCLPVHCHGLPPLLKLASACR